jgi:hypothetical protein
MHCDKLKQYEPTENIPRSPGGAGSLPGTVETDEGQRQVIYQGTRFHGGVRRFSNSRGFDFTKTMITAPFTQFLRPGPRRREVVMDLPDSVRSQVDLILGLGLNLRLKK